MTEQAAHPKSEIPGAPVRNPKLQRIHPVLVRPRISANIGAAVRAAKSMGLGSVMLIEPHAGITEAAVSLAAGAVKELQSVKSFASLEEPVNHAVRVFGFSARRHDHRSQPVWLEDAAAEALTASERGTVLLLFGTERTGLENEELDHAQKIVRIPTSSRFKSLNLAQSVMVAAYEIRKRAGAAMEPYGYEPALAGDIERFIDAFVDALDRRDFFVSSKRELAIRRLRDLLGRAAPFANEVQLLRGMIRALDEE